MPPPLTQLVVNKKPIEIKTNIAKVNAPNFDKVGTLKCRNKERKNGDAKRSFKHGILKVNGALAISSFQYDFLVRFASRQNEHVKKKRYCFLILPHINLTKITNQAL